MALTVREILALPVVARGQPVVVGGASRLDRPVRWVHIIDAADLTGLLQGGELVLSVGRALVGGLQEVESYLRLLADLGAAGLVVELGTKIAALPAEVGRLADELGLPVIELHARIRYVDVTEHVHRMIVTDRYEEVQFARITHEAFTGLNIGRASPRQIVGKAAELVGAPVVLEDLSRHVLAFADPAAGPGGTAMALLDDWAERSRRSSGERAVGGWLAVPVGADGQRWGRLVLASGLVERGRAAMVLERAAQSLLLQRMVEHDRDALLVQALGGLLDDLVSGRVSDDAEASARAGALGLSVSARYAPLVIKIARSGPNPTASDRPGSDSVDRTGPALERPDWRMSSPTSGMTSSKSSAATTRSSVLESPGARDAAGELTHPDVIRDALAQGAIDRQLLAAARQAVTGAGLTAIGSVRREGTVALLIGCPYPAAVDGSLAAVVNGIRERLGSRGQDRWVAGTAPAAAGLVAAADGLIEAEQVAEVGLGMPGSQRLLRSADIRLRGLLALLRGDQRVQDFARFELGRLLEHDQRTGDNLVALLRTFLAVGGRKSAAAAAAGLSRPTLYARLGAIERILGVSLESAESRASLLAAFMISDSHP